MSRYRYTPLLREAVRRLQASFYFVVTSMERHTGTHRYAAVDVAPRYPVSHKPLAYVAHRHLAFSGDRQAIIDLLKDLTNIGLVVAIENDHIHLHDAAAIAEVDPQFAATLPKPGIYIKIPKDKAI